MAGDFFLGRTYSGPPSTPDARCPSRRFFALYRPLFKDSEGGTMSFSSQRKPGSVWIDSKDPHSNNKGWDLEFFYVYEEWECPSRQALFEKEKVPREWGALKKEWDKFPTLTREQKKQVQAALGYAESTEDSVRDYDAIVIDASLWEAFRYLIPEGDVPISRRSGKSKASTASPSDRSKRTKLPSHCNQLPPN